MADTEAASLDSPDARDVWLKIGQLQQQLVQLTEQHTQLREQLQAEARQSPWRPIRWSDLVLWVAVFVMNLRLIEFKPEPLIFLLLGLPFVLLMFFIPAFRYNIHRHRLDEQLSTAEARYLSERSRLESQLVRLERSA